MLKSYVRDCVLWILGKSFKSEYRQAKAQIQPEFYLRDLIIHAYKNVPYYTKVLHEAGIVHNNKVNLSKFSEIPILTKEILRSELSSLTSKDCLQRKWYYNSSGGSTGEPVRFIQDDAYLKWGKAALYYWYRDILNVDEPRARKAILWGSERDIFQGGIGTKGKISNWLKNTLFLNSFRMTDENMRDYIQRINEFKPLIIRGYVSSLIELCRYARVNGLKIHTPGMVVSSAEVLREDDRHLIEETLSAHVYNFYGSREVNTIAGECSEGLLHVFSFHSHVEIVKGNGQPAREGEEGKVIITNLHNYSMPFIRYEIGDMAVRGPEKCKCGNLLPTIRNITGRITHHFITRNGTAIYGEYFTHLFYGKDFVKAFQVIQENYDIVKILMVLNKKMTDENRCEVENKVKLVMGNDCQIIWNFVNEIPVTPQGKYIYTKSLVKR